MKRRFKRRKFSSQRKRTQAIRARHARKLTWRIDYEVVREGSVTITARTTAERDQIFENLSLTDLEASARNDDVVITHTKRLGHPRKESA